MVITALGDTEDIGASCYFLQINGTGLALDAGLDPKGHGPNSLPRFSIVRKRLKQHVDHALVTHAHRDHMGALPLLIKQFPHVNVHMTPATRQLVELLLPASARLQRRRRQEGSSPYEPLFDEKDVESQSYLYLTHGLEEAFDVTGPRGDVPVKAQFYDAGHILGSAGVLLEYEESGRQRRFFYTSDTNLEAQTILPGGSYPEPPVDTLILESTLGSDPEAERTTRTKEEEKFAGALIRTIEQGGTVLVPVFAMGRAQETLALIDRLKKEGDLPEKVPVYTAGIMRGIAELYDDTRSITPRLNSDFRVYGVDQQRVPRSRRAKQETISEPSIHVVTSGMMFGPTLSNKLGRWLVEEEKNAILLVGFSKEDTPARRLLEAAEQGTDVVLHEKTGPQPVNCSVHRFRFSGHSHRRELLSLVERLNPSNVLLVHGEQEARGWMADNIRHLYPEVNVYRPALGESIDL